MERFAAISPDGEKVVYGWNGGSGSAEHLYVQLVGGSEPLQLTSENWRDYSPAWSPDGRQIAFLREIREPGQPGRSEIRVISALGGKETRLGTAAIRIEIGPDFVSGLDWSPDGRYLAFSDKESAGEQESIFLLSIETGEKRRLSRPPAMQAPPRDREPAFSPDGKTVAFIRGRGITEHQILLQSLEEGEPPHSLTTEEDEIYDVDWVPDGSALIYAWHRWNERGLTRISVPGGRRSDLGWGGGAISVSLSGDGRRLAYTRDDRTLLNIWRAAGPAAKHPTQPAKLMDVSRTDFLPEFSPDGTQIAFTSFRSGSLAVWVCDSDGTNCSQIADDDSISPRWSPDGSKVGYIKTVDGKPDLYFTSLERAFTRRLSRGGIGDLWPFAWARDGFSIDNDVYLYASDSQSIDILSRYIVRCPVSLQRLHYDEKSNYVLYHPKSKNRKAELLDPLEFLARVHTHIPQPNQHSILYYGLYARRTRKPTGNKRQHTTDAEDSELDKTQRKSIRRRWANLIRRVFKTDPLICKNCGGQMRIASFITQPNVIRQILDHLEKRNSRDPPGP